MVFGTLHTTGAAKTVDRIVDVFPAGEKEMVFDVVRIPARAVISQTLLKTRDGKRSCRRTRNPHFHPAVRNLIRETKSPKSTPRCKPVNHTACKPLDQALQTLVRQGTISPDVARSKAQNSDSMTIV